MLCPKNCVYKCEVKKIICSQFFVQNNSWVQKNFESKIFCSEKNFGQKILIQNNLGPKKI